MSIRYPSDGLEAYRLTAAIVAKEAQHLEQTYRRLLLLPIDAALVASLEENPDIAERV